MLNLFLPNKQVESIYDITPAFLQEINKKGIIVDLDNTLVPWNIAHATEEVVIWLRTMEAAGLKVIIFSNNNKERVKLFAEPLNIPYIYKANKPLKSQFQRALQRMGLNREDVVVIGDQLLTDILGGNRVGLYTILVLPIIQTDAKITQFNRLTERMILNKLYQEGKISRRYLDD